MKDSGLVIVSLVAVVAIVGLVMLLQSGSTGLAVDSMSGSAQRSFGRAYGSDSLGGFGSYEAGTCWEDAEGQIRCPDYQRK